MNAYELAEFIETGGENIDRKELINTLRQQADRIAELEKEIEECWCGGHSYAYLRAKNRLPQTKPLSDEEIVQIGKTCDLNHVLGLIDFAKAIEERHGIK